MKSFTLVLSLIGIVVSSLTAQVKIGDNPNTINPNSLLELESGTKGFLPPRMALNSLSSVAPMTGTVPAGMMIYSSGGTLPDGYYMWNGTGWISFSTSTSARSNYVLVKSASDFPAPAGGVISLVAGTYYEINGTITLTNKINLNGCTIEGQDGINDKLVYTGAEELFTGANTGTLLSLTLSAPFGKVFNINGGGASKNLIVQNCFFLGSNTVGTIQGLAGSVFFSTTAFFGNANGITFQNITNVILNFSNWAADNFNVYETFIGTFNIIQILGGNRLTTSTNTATAIDITGLTSVNSGSIKVVVFLGTGTPIDGTFSNDWEVESYGLPTEKDDVSTGNLYSTTSSNTPFAASNTPTKVLNPTTAVNLFRVSSPANNTLTYTGHKTKNFLVICSVSLTAVGTNNAYSFYIAKNGIVLPESRAATKLSNTADQQSIGLSCTVSLTPNDYIEIWVECNSGTTTVTVPALNLAID